jgi:hypothetical protein
MYELYRGSSDALLKRAVVFDFHDETEQVSNFRN